MANLCIIPARGGSKRIPRKNIKDFLGKPVIAYSIQAAISSHLFDEIMVSTDDEEIAELALKLNAKVPYKRSDENSGDFATTADVIYEVLKYYENIGMTFDYVCCIYPCAPFVNKTVLNTAYSKLKDGNFDTVFPLVEYQTPIQRAFKFNNDETSFYFSEFENTRSQDLERAYYDAGQFYWLNTITFLSNKKILTNNTSSIILSSFQSQDIDNLSDWNIAELKYLNFNQENNKNGDSLL
jgi:pseudaminic acid cytidylyltransferase